ncbi:Uncharacterised protein [Vibrio cholerae]|uniref:Uncharacterized protein n=1 Tax=Vibrio cholerae TaxID=666 RepID=A0A656AIE8_VIBCL|nr:Uncharacterised protein [Vibrio cholerae]CSC48848.1 Uncharacterised protein [Vibrio cholerae]CSD12744.1 Uncharacterised protein [Vibrio cholerae]
MFINTGHVYGILCSEECHIGNGFIVSRNTTLANTSTSNNPLITGLYHFL